MKKQLFTLIALFAATAHLCAKEQKIGVVNFDNCVTDSKLGKQEQNAFETMQKQFVSLVEDTDKKLREESSKLQDKDFLDGLSKEGEEALHQKIAILQEERERYSQQYYQFMDQGRYKIMQSVVQGISSVAGNIADAKGLTVILNKGACFYSADEFDITAEVIRELDKNSEKASDEQAAR